MDRVDIQVFGSIQLAVRSLQNADGGLFTIDSTAIGEDGLAELLGHREFVMNGIVGNSVHGSPQQAPLAFHLANWLSSVFRQPGEYRNLRMRHSIRHQDLLTLGVVGQRMRIAKSRNGLIGRRTSNYAQRRNVAIRVGVINGGSMVAEIGHPQLIVFLVQKNTQWDC